MKNLEIENKKPTVSALGNIERLRRLAMAVKDLGDDARWLAAGLTRYLAAAPSGLKLDEALGVACRQAERPWWELERLARRDELVCQLLRGEYAMRGAAALAADLRQYEARGFVNDRRAGRATGSAFGTARQAFFKILECGPAIGLRQINRIVDKTTDIGQGVQCPEENASMPTGLEKYR